MTSNDFKNVLQEVILPSDRVVVVYSGIWTFGHLFEANPRTLPVLLLDTLLEFCGRERTLVFPTYTNSFARTRRYDLLNSMPETGVLSTTFLHRYGAARSLSAMNSFAAIGPAADTLARMKGETLWGKSSVKEYLENVNARIVMLGLPWSLACGFLHRMEEVAQVPYRYYKTFHGVRIDGGRESPWAETMYVRPLRCPIVFCWERVVDRMWARGLMLSGSPQFVLKSALAKDITSIGLQLLADNPYAVLVNEAEVREWVQNGKQLELEELKRSEPAALSHHGAFNA